MDISTLLDVGGERAGQVLESLMAPALMPLGRVHVSAELWEEERHVRLIGDALYAVHRGSEAWWVVAVKESNALAPGCLRMIPLGEIRCESPGGRRAG